MLQCTVFLGGTSDMAWYLSTKPKNKEFMKTDNNMKKIN